jgi:hypothetical protein
MCGFPKKGEFGHELIGLGSRVVELGHWLHANAGSPRHFRLDESEGPRREQSKIDVVIIGGGAVGTHLLDLGTRLRYRVTVVTRRHRDPTKGDFHRSDGSVRMVSSKGRERVIPGSAYRKIVYDEDRPLPREILDEGVKADFLFTAVRSDNVCNLVPLVADIIARRSAERVLSPLAIVFCENIPVGDATLAVFESRLLGALSRAERAYAEKWVSFGLGIVQEVIFDSRSPVDMCRPDANDPHFMVKGMLDDGREPALIVGRVPTAFGDFHGAVPSLPGALLTDDIPFYRDRKLYVYNMGHLVLALVAHFLGKEVLPDALGDLVWQATVKAIVQGAMIEAASAIARRWESVCTQADMSLDEYIGLRIAEFGDPRLPDRVERICRNIDRKFGPHERLVGAAHLARQQDVHCPYLLLGVLLAHRYAQDPETKQDPGVVAKADVSETYLRQYGVWVEEEIGNGLSVEDEIRKNGIRDFLWSYPSRVASSAALSMTH